jgi:hypothetical protein
MDRKRDADSEEPSENDQGGDLGESARATERRLKAWCIQFFQLHDCKLGSSLDGLDELTRLVVGERGVSTKSESVARSVRSLIAPPSRVPR